MEKTTKTKILYLITKSNWGGAQRYVYDMATGLDKEKYDVSVAVGGSGELVNELTTAAITVHPIPGLQRDISLYKEILASWHIAKIIRQEDPDILHVNSSKAGFIGALLGRVLGVPLVIYTCHGWAFNEDRGWFSRQLVTLLHWITVLAAHTTITVSEAVRSQMILPGTKNKMKTIHNGANLPDFIDRTIARHKLMEIEPRLSAYHEDNWGITIGELHKTKQHDVTIRAISKLVQKELNFRHIIIGKGEERAALLKLIEELNVSENVFLLGEVPKASRLLKAADLFILSSRSEALGYVVLEAAQAELPIIASNVGGIPEIVENGESAILFKDSDVNSLYEAILLLWSNNELAAALAASAYKKSQTFSIEKMIEETTAVYSTQR